MDEPIPQVGCQEWQEIALLEYSRIRDCGGLLAYLGNLPVFAQVRVIKTAHIQQCAVCKQASDQVNAMLANPEYRRKLADAMVLLG